MAALARIATKTFIITATTTAINLNAQPDGVQYGFVIIKNEGTSPVFVAESPTAVSAVYPTAGNATTAVPQTGVTVLAGQTEVYEKDNDNGYLSLILPSGATDGPVHIKLAADL